MRDYNMSGIVAGFPKQTIHEESEEQQYPIGMIHERHGRRWRYFRTVEAITAALTGRACPNMAIVPGDDGGTVGVYGSEGSFAADALEGATKVSVNNGGTTCFPVDFFVDGTMVVFSTGLTPAIFLCRISGNDLFDATSGFIYLDEPIPVEVAHTSYGVSIYPSPYQNVGASGSGSLTLRTFVVVPVTAVQSGFYAWGQTKGPCWVTPSPFGSGRIKVFHSNGTIKDRADGSISQIAGNAIPADFDGGYGDGLIDLDIDGF